MTPAEECMAGSRAELESRAEALQVRVAELEAELKEVRELGTEQAARARAAESRAEALQARVAELENRTRAVRGDWRDNMTKSSLRNLHPAAVMALDAWDDELRRSYTGELATAKARVAELKAVAQAASSEARSAVSRAVFAESELERMRERVARAIEWLECLGAPIWMPAGARRALEALRGR